MWLVISFQRLKGWRRWISCLEIFCNFFQGCLWFLVSFSRQIYEQKAYKPFTPDYFPKFNLPLPYKRNQMISCLSLCIWEEKRPKIFYLNENFLLFSYWLTSNNSTSSAEPADEVYMYVFYIWIWLTFIPQSNLPTTKKTNEPPKHHTSTWDEHHTAYSAWKHSLNLSKGPELSFALYYEFNLKPNICCAAHVSMSFILCSPRVEPNQSVLLIKIYKQCIPPFFWAIINHQVQIHVLYS